MPDNDVFTGQRDANLTGRCALATDLAFQPFTQPLGVVDGNRFRDVQRKTLANLYRPAFNGRFDAADPMRFQVNCKEIRHWLFFLILLPLQASCASLGMPFPVLQFDMSFRLRRLLFVMLPKSNQLVPSSMIPVSSVFV